MVIQLLLSYRQCKEEYIAFLIDMLNKRRANVSLFLPLPEEVPTHPFVAGDKVLTKCLNPRKVGKAEYSPPTKVIAVTYTAVRTCFLVLLFS